MASINYLYRSTKEKSYLTLRLLFRFNDEDYVYGVKTRELVTKSYWNDYHTKRIRDIDIINAKAEINSKLAQIEAYILEKFEHTNPLTINKDWLQNQINNYYSPPAINKGFPIELTKYIDSYIEFKRNEISIGTIKKCRVIQRLLQRYEEDTKRDLLIKEIDLSFKKDFESYCLKNEYALNTISRALRFVKTICKHAHSNGLETNYQLEHIKIKYYKTHHTYLSFDDLDIIENTPYLTEYLINAKDWLIISCYMGQRVSDFMRFTKEMIRYEKNKEGKLRPLIEFTQKKTSKIMTIPVHKKVVEILKKRQGDFPRAISDQRYNDYIKEVCRLAGINDKIIGTKKVLKSIESNNYRNETKHYQKWELVTSHIGRRSFATNFYGSSVPTSFLMYVTGHSTEANFLKYIGKSNKDIAMELTYHFN